MDNPNEVAIEGEIPVIGEIPVTDKIPVSGVYSESGANGFSLSSAINFSERDNGDNDDDFRNWDPSQDNFVNATSRFATLTQEEEDALDELQKRIEESFCRSETVKATKYWKVDPVRRTKIRRVPISYIDQLEEKNYAAVDSIMEVTVAYAKHPWKFFVNCDRGWGCPCNITAKGMKKMKSLPSSPRVKLEQLLNDYMLADFKYKRVDLKCSHYFEFQLVVVLIKEEGKKRFVRGVVQETTLDDQPGRKIKVQLLDTGEKKEVHFRHLYSLPTFYIEYGSCLAYQCKLFGVSPFYYKWTPEASVYFSKLVVGKKCTLTVKHPTTAFSDSPQKLFEVRYPYQVELRVRCENEKCSEYHNVSEMLAEKFHGVLWNSTPFRPYLENLIPTENLIPRADLTLLTKPAILKADLENIVEREE